LRAASSKTSSKYATISNSIVLVLIGFFTLLYLHSESITNLLKERINVLVELKDDANIESLKSYLSKQPEIIEGSVKFISKKNAGQLLGIDQEMGVSIDSISIFKDILSFNVKSEYYSDQTISKLKSSIKSQPGVADFFHENVEINNIRSNIKNVSFFILVLSIVFVILAIVIMYNTIRLSLYSDQSEIKTMVVIGARDNFIRQPYIKLAGNIALRSFGIATVIILIAIFWFASSFSILGVLKWYLILLAILFIFIISLLICVGSTVSIVNNYLKDPNQ
jgi:cell division transport system permease protein